MLAILKNKYLLTKVAHHKNKLSTLNLPNLQRTKFPNLTILNMSSNYIVSLGSIACLEAPNLR